MTSGMTSGIMEASFADLLKMLMDVTGLLTLLSGRRRRVRLRILYLLIV
jgi:hypothetical protein